MSFRRKFHGSPVVRLIVSVPVEVADEVDNLIGYPHCREWRKSAATHPARRNRSEFVSAPAPGSRRQKLPKTGFYQPLMGFESCRNLDHFMGLGFLTPETKQPPVNGGW